MSTPTPRTDEARRIDNGDTHPLLDEMETMERELAHERETSRLLTVAMNVRDEGYTEMRKLLSKVETELATERARLDWLSTRGFEHRHHETGDHLGYEWTISSYSESEDVTLRDVIDAEMQEEAK